MLAGRAGVIAASNARKYQVHRDSLDQGNKDQLETDHFLSFNYKIFSILNALQININKDANISKNKKYQNLYNILLVIINLKSIEYYKAAWCVGILMTIIGGYLLYHVSLGKKGGSLFNGFREGHWWQYFIAIIIIILGISFLLVVKAERVIFNKDKNVLIVTKKSFCALRQKENTRKLNALGAIQIIKRGHDSISNKTIHYKIILHFFEERKLEILESHSKTKIKKKYIEVKVFLNQEIEKAADIHIIDESTGGSRYNEAPDNRL